MNNPSLIANLKRIFLTEGMDGLKEKLKGRLPMSRSRKPKPGNQEKKTTREEQMERRNELLRLGNAYLKKLKTFQEDPNAFFEKHKQQWHSNLKKKDLKDVLKVVGISESIYHYQISQMGMEDSDKEWKDLISEIFHKHEGRYGYRRIHAELVAKGYKINHKKVQRIMQELELKCIKSTRKSRNKSYKGKVGTVAKNRLNRRFNTPILLQKLVTDVTEYKLYRG